MIAVKRSEPLTVDKAKALWKIHKKTYSCGGHKWQAFKRRGGKLKGFQCKWGYDYSQKQPMLLGTTKPREVSVKVI